MRLLFLILISLIPVYSAALFPSGSLSNLAVNFSRSNIYYLAVEEISSGKTVYEAGDNTIGSEPQPLGSVMKLFAVLTKYKNHPVDPGETYECKPYDPANPQKRCWLLSGHGKLTLIPAIAQSCNVYFSQFAADIDFREYLETLKLAGVLTGNENFGQTQLNRDEQIRAMIGRMHYIQIRPLDFLHFYSSLISGSKIIPDDIREVLMDGMHLSYVLGTASKARKDLKLSSELDVVCKTGTGVYEEDGKIDLRRTNGFFIGAYNKKYAVMVFVRDAVGSDEASRLGLSVIKVLSGIKN